MSIDDAYDVLNLAKGQGQWVVFILHYFCDFNYVYWLTIDNCIEFKNNGLQDWKVTFLFFRHEESKIRKAYFRLAQKYHPDKNPEGRVGLRILTGTLLLSIRITQPDMWIYCGSFRTCLRKSTKPTSSFVQSRPKSWMVPTQKTSSLSLKLKAFCSTVTNKVSFMELTCCSHTLVPNTTFRTSCLSSIRTGTVQIRWLSYANQNHHNGNRGQSALLQSLPSSPSCCRISIPHRQLLGSECRGAASGQWHWGMPVADLEKKWPKLHKTLTILMCFLIHSVVIDAIFVHSGAVGGSVSVCWRLNCIQQTRWYGCTGNYQNLSSLHIQIFSMLHSLHSRFFLFFYRCAGTSVNATV